MRRPWFDVRPLKYIAKPEDLFDDPQLNLGGGLESMEFPDKKVGKMPRLPLEWNGERFPFVSKPPLLGEHSRNILQTWLNCSPEDIESLATHNIIRTCD